MIFCKFLWAALSHDMGCEPQVGWNITKTYGPVYIYIYIYIYIYVGNTAPRHRKSPSLFRARDITLSPRMAPSWLLLVAGADVKAFLTTPTPRSGPTTSYWHSCPVPWRRLTKRWTGRQGTTPTWLRHSLSGSSPPRELFPRGKHLR